MTLSISQAAAEFGHHRQTIAKRIIELTIPASGERHGRPVYRLRDLLVIERATEAGKINPDRLGPFERNAYYKSETERVELGKKVGTLLELEDVEDEWARVTKLFVLGLDTVVDELERDLMLPAAVLEKLEQKIDAIREQIADQICANTTPGESTDADHQHDRSAPASDDRAGDAGGPAAPGGNG